MRSMVEGARPGAELEAAPSTTPAARSPFPVNGTGKSWRTSQTSRFQPQAWVTLGRLMNTEGSSRAFTRSEM